MGNLALVGFTEFEPLETGDVIGALAEIGVIILLFEVGQKKAIAERADRVRRAKYHWGNDWFILPNPMYGEWRRLCGDNPRGKLKVTAMKQVPQFNAIH